MTRTQKYLTGSLSLALSLVAIQGCSTSPLGRKQLIVLPDGQMNTMGVQAFDEMKKQTPVETDPALNQFVKCVALPITVAAKDQVGADQWEIVVFKDDTANAFALPGGKIGVHTGILKVAKTDAQLAAVLGHEVGHVIARHGNERMSEGLAQGLVVNAAAAILGSDSTGKQFALAALGLGTQVGYALPHSRTQESEADLIGLDLMSRAGFDPRQSVELWKNMMANSKGAPPEFLSTHPANQTRIDNLSNNMAPAVDQYQSARAGGHAPTCPHP